MPFKYERDDANRRVVVTLYGEYQKEESFEILARHRVDKIGSYSVIYDLLRLKGAPDVADLRSFMSQESTIPADKSRGPIAIVTNDNNMYALACAYAALGRPKLRIEVFRERREADTWLLLIEKNTQ